MVKRIIGNKLIQKPSIANTLFSSRCLIPTTPRITLRIFPNEASCLRLVSVVLMEISETWETGRIYLSFFKVLNFKYYGSPDYFYRKDVAQSVVVFLISILITIQN